MTARRLAQAAHKSPSLTRGDDQPEPACADSLYLVDAVYARGEFGRQASKHLLPLCGGCELRPTCWADQEWRNALRGVA